MWFLPSTTDANTNTKSDTNDNVALAFTVFADIMHMQSIAQILFMEVVVEQRALVVELVREGQDRHFLELLAHAEKALAS